MRFAFFALAFGISCATPRAIPPKTAAAGATLVIENQMDSYFVLDATRASIDGQTISTQPGAIVPVTVGRHELAVDMTFHYESRYIFSYVRAWSFVVHGKHGFDVADGAKVELHAIAYEKGGVTTPIEERPAMRFVER